MCTVEVVLIADVLRLTDGPRFRTPGVPPRSICRRLFEDDGGESATACVKRLEANIQREMRQRWNFDFRTETPLPGRYQWAPVSSGVRRVPAKMTTELKQATSSTKIDNRLQNTAVPQQAKSKSQPSPTQSKITDFLHQRKRLRTMESDLPCPKPLKVRRTAESMSPAVVTID